MLFLSFIRLNFGKSKSDRINSTLSTFALTTKLTKNINTEMKNIKIQDILYVCLALASVSTLFSSPIALLLGILFAIFFSNSFEKYTHNYIHLFLKTSIVGLGFGLNIHEALLAGESGFILTTSTIVTVLGLGYLLGKLIKVDQVTAFLLSVGTAICGGSAIAAVSPIVKADNKQISLSLAIIFTLNSIGLLIYPMIGDLLHLTQEQFGLWAAIGIHDTSSVVGAANKYGSEALKIATTVKLARALWIIPVSIFTMFIFKNKESKIKIPWFIGLFILAILLNTYIPDLNIVSPYIVKIAKAGLNLTLFLVGTTFTLPMIKTISWKPMMLAVILWVLISVSSLMVIVSF
jgi:uncharacterized integral membrane protein (TIGR00698 family)